MSKLFVIPVFILLATCIPALFLTECSSPQTERPNILWITCEDISPHLGCYGDPYAHTPNLDRMAATGIRYQNAFAPAPVCTPARSSIITGVYASSLGTQHLRGPAPLSGSIRCFTEYLRKAGYYCSNNSKEDYNFTTPVSAWDESSETAHWRNRQEGQPFFSVFNFTLTHQSQTRYLQDKLTQINDTLAPEERHDPGKAPLPPYYPDTRIVRQNVAALYTQITLMDRKVKELLEQLEEDGLAEHTIVFFYSDHGDGLPRGKRWIFDSGTKVPLIIHFPEKYRHLLPGEPGSAADELVSFVDFAPTVLDLAGVEVPGYMQGNVMFGNQETEKRHYVYGIRDRVDEVLEFTRSVRDDRYRYIRNFYPHRPRMQRSFYSEQTPIRQELRRLHAEGKLPEPEQWLMKPQKPAEELYDTRTDPSEMNNLAGDPEHRELLEEMRSELFRWMVETRDLSLLPEAEMHRRSEGGSPCDMARDPEVYTVKDILLVADLVGRGPEYLDEMASALDHPDPAIRYWGAVGLAALGEQARPAEKELQQALSDETPCVRFAAAEALTGLGHTDEPVRVLAGGLSHEDPLVSLMAVQTLVAVKDRVSPPVPQLEELIEKPEQAGDIGWYTREAATWLLQSSLSYSTPNMMNEPRP